MAKPKGKAPQPKKSQPAQPTGQYTVDPRNARKHPVRNLEAVKESLHNLGAGRSIVVDSEGVIIGGNALLRDVRPVMRADLNPRRPAQSALQDSPQDQLERRCPEDPAARVEEGTEPRWQSLKRG